MSKKHKKPGSVWRILAWNKSGTRKAEAHSDGETVFDELVIDNWFHLEQMDTRKWWLKIANRVWWFRVRKNGTVEITEDSNV